MKKRYTIKDVAELSQVSIATVSHILNGKTDRVSFETIEKVNRIIKDIGYVRSHSARAFKGKGSKLIGIIIPQLPTNEKLISDNPFYSEFISGVEHSLRNKGFGLVLNVYSGQEKFKETCLSWNLDGVIAFGSDEQEIVDLLLEIDLDILFVDSYKKDINAYYLNINDFQASYDLTEFLVKEGHKNFAFVTGNIPEKGVLRERFEGFKKALFDSDLKYDPRLVLQGDVTLQHGEKSARKILDIDSTVTCIISTADIIAHGLNLNFLKEGIKVPDDISIAGFDDTYLSKVMYPQLTTVNQNISLRGEIAGDLIVEVINKKQVQREIYTQYEIIKRGSTKKL